MTRRRAEYTAEEIAEAKRRYEEEPDQSIGEIARDLNIPRTTISAWAKRQGWAPRATTEERRNATQKGLDAANERRAFDIAKHRQRHMADLGEVLDGLIGRVKETIAAGDAKLNRQWMLSYAIGLDKLLVLDARSSGSGDPMSTDPAQLSEAIDQLVQAHTPEES